MTKLTLTQSNNIEYKKLQDLIATIRTTYHSMMADKHKKANYAGSKQDEIIDHGIINDALYNSKIESQNLKQINMQSNEGENIDFDIQK